MFCLHGSIICPSAQMVYTKADSYIRCGEIEIPILSAHNTKDGIPRAIAPKTCPLCKVEPALETIVRIIEDPSVAAKWGTKKSRKRSLTDAQVFDILTRAEKGEMYKNIAESHGTCIAVISSIMTGRRYTDVVKRFKWV